MRFETVCPFSFIFLIFHTKLNQCWNLKQFRPAVCKILASYLIEEYGENIGLFLILFGGFKNEKKRAKEFFDLPI